VPMRLAIAKAREGIAQGQTPFGACIVKGGKIVACRHNSVWAATDITAHAEILAIREACTALGTIDLTDCVMYSTCEPCPMCFSACHWARISLIVYGADIGAAQQADFHELTIPSKDMKRLGDSPVNLIGGVLFEEASGLFDEWTALGLSASY
jgi:guanine deaminase